MGVCALVSDSSATTEESQLTRLVLFITSVVGGWWRGKNADNAPRLDASAAAPCRVDVRRKGDLVVVLTPPSEGDSARSGSDVYPVFSEEELLTEVRTYERVVRHADGHPPQPTANYGFYSAYRDWKECSYSD